MQINGSDSDLGRKNPSGYFEDLFFLVLGSIKSDNSIWRFRYNRVLRRRTKPMTWQIECPSSSENLSMETLMEEFNMSFWRNVSFNIKENQCQLRFWAFPQYENQTKRCFRRHIFEMFVYFVIRRLMIIGKQFIEKAEEKFNSSINIFTQPFLNSFNYYHRSI